MTHNRSMPWLMRQACFLILLLALSACASAAVSPTSTALATAAAFATATATSTPISTTSGQPTSPVSAATPPPPAPPLATKAPPPTAKSALRATEVTPAVITVSAGRVTVPILLYHHVSDKGSTRYFIAQADFQAQMKLLADAGYQTVSISQLAEVIRNGGELPVKPVVITFDDGYLDTYQNAFPVLERYGFKGVAYVITGTIGTEKAYGYMQVDELKALAAAGWEIGSHSISHSNLKTTKLGMRNEIETSKKDLEEQLGVEVRSFSYPFGVANQWIEDRVAEYGYDSGVGLDIFVSQTPKRLYYLSRREVQRGLLLDDFRALLTPGAEEMAALLSATATPTPHP